MTIATELRALASQIEQIARDSRVASLALPMIAPLIECLSMRAAISELDSAAVRILRPDSAELQARVEDAIRNSGDYAVRAITEGLDLGDRARVVAITIALLRGARRETRRAADLVGEIREAAQDGSAWTLRQLINELEACLARALP